MWMACPASIGAQIEFRAKFPDRVRGDTIHSIRGTQAHQVCEDYVLGTVPARPDDDSLTEREWDEMLKYGLAFKEYVMDLVGEGDLLLVEKRLHMGKIAKNMYGTGDITVYNKDTRHLHIVDYKFGRGVVTAEENTQLQCYAVGANDMVKDLGQSSPKTFTVHIYQPRTPGEAADSWDFDIKQLQSFTLRAREAALATEDEDPPFVPGEKQCQWCDAAPTCYAYREFCVNEALSLTDLLDDLTEDSAHDAADELKTRSPDEFDVEALAQLRKIFPAAKRWMEAVDKFLLAETQAGNVKSLKIVEGKGSNSCTDEEAVEFMIGEAAYKPKALKSKSELERLVGKKNFPHLLGDYFERKPGRPSLADINDKRPALKTDADLIDMMDSHED